MSEIILFDLPSKGHCASWSPNPWKTRLALNFKGLEYETQWLEYPDVGPTLKSLDVTPNSSEPAYTIPALRLTGKTYVMDSQAIAEALESSYPTPSLHLDAPVLAKVNDLIPKMLMPLLPIWMPRVPTELLNPPSKEYFERTRGEKVGMPLARLAEEKAGEGCWVGAKPALEELVGLLGKEEGGPFFMGETASYADFVVVAVLQFWKRLGLYERFVQGQPALEKLYEACGEWLAKED